jgi:hypothetical protein
MDFPRKFRCAEAHRDRFFQAINKSRDVHAGGASALSKPPVKYLIFDEVSRFPSSVKGRRSDEGDLGKRALFYPSIPRAQGVRRKP